ncbi:MAG: AarF/UbiB family protein, partial [Bdellovibrionia bacterium]
SRHPNMNEFYENFRPFVLEVARDPKQKWITRDDGLSQSRVAPKHYKMYQNIEDLKELFLRGIYEVDRADVSGGNKVESFFKLLVYFRNYYGESEQRLILERLNLDQRVWIRGFLARNSSALTVPVEQLVLESFRTDVSSLQSLQRSLELKTVKQLFSPLVRGHGRWTSFPAIHPILGIESGSRYKSPSHLHYLLVQMESPAMFEPTYDQFVVDHMTKYFDRLAALPATELNEFFDAEFVRFGEVFAQFETSLKRLPLRLTELGRAMKTVHARFAVYRDEQLRSYLKTSSHTANSKFLQALVTGPAFRDSEFPVERSIKESFQNLLLDRVGHTADVTTLFPEDLARGITPQSLVYSEFLENPHVSAVRRKYALRALITSQTPEIESMSNSEAALVSARFTKYVLNEYGIETLLSEFLSLGYVQALPLIGRNPEMLARLISTLDGAKRVQVIGTLLDTSAKALQPEASKVLVVLLLDSAKGAVSYEWWMRSLTRLRELNPAALTGDRALEGQATAFIAKSLRQTGHQQRKQWLKAHDTLKILSPRAGAELLLSVVIDEHDRFADRGRSLKAGRDLAVEFKLADDFGAIYREMKTLAAARYKMQPHELKTYFVEPAASITVRSADARGIIRGISALVEEVQRHGAERQYEAIRYLLGELAEVPDFLLKAASETGAAAQALAQLDYIRSRLKDGESTERVFMVDSILAGPDGLLAKPGGLEMLKSKLFSSVRPTQLGLATDVMNAVIRSYNGSESLPVAFILGRKSTGSADNNDIEFLKALLVAHGAPGIKFGQYLAFTEPALEPYLAELQDSAKELSHLEAIEILNERFGENWNTKYEFLDVLGTGSVNAALQLRDKQTGRMVVMSVGYPNIEAQTEANFRRIKRIVAELTATPEGFRKYGHLVELIPLIEDSVRLEFNKANALAVMGEARKVYHGEIDGWKIETVRGFSAENMSVVMELASGVTARKMKQSDRATYNSAMGALSKREQALIMGRFEEFTADASFRPYANPDFHDGQVLIDPVTRKVYLLDFGQGTFFSHPDMAFELLRAVSGVDSARVTYRRIQQTFYSIPGAPSRLRLSDIEDILESETRMAKFVKLVGKIRATGGNVPLDAVNWVFATHRQTELTGRLGDNTFKNLLSRTVLADKFGLHFLRPNRTLPSGAVSCKQLFLP